MGRLGLRMPGTRALALGVVVCLGLAYSVLLLGDSAVERLADNPSGAVQNVGAAALLGASILFGAAFVRSRQPAFLLLGLAFFFGAGEEASWGQSILGYEPPAAIAEVNAQDEVTLHNLNFVQDARHAVGFDLVLAAFIAFALAWTVVVPLLASRSSRTHRALTRWVPLVPGAFGALLIVNLVLFATAGVLSGSDRAHAITEIAEAGFSLLFLGIAAHIAQSARPAPGPCSATVSVRTGALAKHRRQPVRP